MPPTSNNLYVSDRHGRHRHSSADYKAFQQDCRNWHLLTKHALTRAAIDISGWIASGRQISIERFYFFAKYRVLAKNSTGPRILDTSNRIKAMDDAIAKMITIDDKHFFQGSAEKIELNSTTAPEYACVHLKPYVQRLPEFIRNEDSIQHPGHLVLTRKEGEGIDIGQGFIQVYLQTIQNYNKARISIAAPKTCKIMRIE